MVSDEVGPWGVAARLIGLGLVAFVALAACAALAWGTGVVGYLIGTPINNHYVQPERRSRLDADADYRRAVEAQAQGLVATYRQARAKLPDDQKALAAWMTANPGPDWTLVQQEEYANLQAAAQGDAAAEARAATSYDALVANPDNAGLLQDDPTLPPSLAVPNGG